MSDLPGKPHKVDDDVNDVPISPPGPDIPMAKAKREAPDQVGAKSPRDPGKNPPGHEQYVDTDKNPNARPPAGHGDQDAGPTESSRNIDTENGGPTPVIGP